MHLHNHAARAEQGGQTIGAEAAVDALTFPNLLSDDWDGDDGSWGQDKQAAETTTVTNSFCILANCVAGHEVAQKTGAAIIEASA